MASASQLPSRGRGISFEKNRPCAPVWHNAALLLQKNRKAYGYELPLRDIPLLRLGQTRARLVFRRLCRGRLPPVAGGLHAPRPHPRRTEAGV